MKRDKLGSIWVDTATLIIGDPCQLLVSGKDTKVPTYDDLMKLAFPGKSPETHARVDELMAKLVSDKMTQEEMEELKEGMMIPSPNKVVLMKNSNGGVGAISYQTGSDGYYPVYVEYDDKGKATRLVIELGGKVKE